MNENWQRERERRQAIWELAELQPGDRAAKTILERLDDLERLDREHPISVCNLSVEQLSELPKEPHKIGCWIIRDANIPEPWRTRFTVALGPAARVAQGFYWHDWADFLLAWERDLEHVQQHRRELDDD
ncbi:hypothetical protein [Pseudomonas guariconensis]|uniref:hypothetical protein n=1 Tax=Pseudomonas guariconensis TaxID=1288410 RepID=UPI0018AC7C17|nr:hypothetical protein [Pseudomonas guariconensis]MBF8742086.1 hypothetical protein [Pseudomonas guariconensis]MBF8751081.1 hypothetical protein [Pseudomonas guariconensis]